MIACHNRNLTANVLGLKGIRCSKTRFSSRIQALSANRFGKYVQRRAYRCRYCSFWHIGRNRHTSKKDPIIIARRKHRRCMMRLYDLIDEYCGVY